MGSKTIYSFFCMGSGMGMRTSIIFSEKCLEYGTWHIEGPDRVRKAYEILKDRGYGFLRPEPASEKDILRVHEAGYVEKLKEGVVTDADTPAYEEIYKYACLSAGGAILAAEVGGFSLMRPPGHHAGVRGAALGAMTKGFCYLNNVAIAVRILDKPTIVLDIDVHHGNGTQEIFTGDKAVTYIGLHRFPHYPGTGYISEDNYLNFPLRADCGNSVFLEALDQALEKVDLSFTEAVAVSAGFDTHAGDLASLGLTNEGYGEIGRRIGLLKKHTFFVLEGGYSGESTGRGIDALLKGFEAK